jgi:hypothetical protein
MSEHCYRIEEIPLQYKQSYLFDESVIDATYILYLEGNGRLPSIQDQLARFRPTRRVYLVVNQGYKRCSNKEPWIHSAAQDLTAANCFVFRHSLNEGYDKVLVLEDDYQFVDRVWDPAVRQSISRFLTTLSNQSDAKYALGSHPLMMAHCSWDLEHYYGVYVQSHANVYTKGFMESILASKPEQLPLLFDWNGVANYLYGEPLCYQLLSQTENRTASWSNPLLDVWISFLELDQKPDGYAFVYSLAKWWWIVLLLLLFCLVLFRVWFGRRGGRIKRGRSI